MHAHPYAQLAQAAGEVDETAIATFAKAREAEEATVALAGR